MSVAHSGETSLLKFRAAVRSLVPPRLDLPALRLVFVVTVAIGCGCAGESPERPRPDAGAGASGFTRAELEAAAELAAKDCEAMARCVPATFTALFASIEACREKNALFWAAQYFGPDSGATEASVAACGAELDLSTCDAFWLWNAGAGAGACVRAGVSTCDELRGLAQGKGPAACFPKGSRPLGSACGSGSQCASGACQFGSSFGEPCGACVAAVAEGERCSGDVACAPGLTCADGTCRPAPGRGQPCHSGCPPHLACNVGGTCVSRLPEGRTCKVPKNGDLPPCDVDVTCNEQTDRCERVEQQTAGARCGVLPDGRFGTCEHGSRCAIFEDANRRECVPEVPLGGACTTHYLFTNACEYPGDCLLGMCALRGPKACP